MSRNSIMQLAVMNSRDYQSSYEDLYYAALSLTLARFQFMVQGFSSTSWIYQALGYGKTQNDQLHLSTVNGFNLELMTGAQLMLSLANNLVFQYTNKGGLQFATPNLLISSHNLCCAGHGPGSSPSSCRSRSVECFMHSARSLTIAARSMSD